MRKKVELLAPAGNYQAFIGAVNAGADAVYLGGEKFGARAYADNFTQEEICKALRYAHVFGRKVYLTVNTLIKENEFPYLYDYLSPLYETGLDGVIIQDLGVWQYIRETFPDMALHASTQMTITGEMGAKFLKQIGAARIVPARELSLSEIIKMKKKTGLELECFIHGAMCYCYSGQCLFSSMLGGRSGNRGRCAQPCRLPYQVSNWPDGVGAKKGYPLSLKDMCTIEFIPQLIEAGIDSFKIEGRMKKPVYAAGVTAIYRKYIDAYYRHGSEAYHIKNVDMDKLNRLYIRTEVQTGYYDKANGKEMVTLKEPGYLGSDETLCQEITEKYLQKEKKYPVAIRGVFRTGESAMLQIEGKDTTAAVYGEVLQQAKKHPLTKDDALKHLRKAGNSFLRITDEEMTIDSDAFMPVGQLNELRRRAMETFEDDLITAHGFPVNRTPVMQDTLQNHPKHEKNGFKNIDDLPKLHVMVQTEEQLQSVCKYTCDRIYIDSDYYIREIDRVSQILEGHDEYEIFLALPYVVRDKDSFYFRRLSALLDRGVIVKGFLARNLESVFWVGSLEHRYELVTDTGIYCFNQETTAFLKKYAQESYLPYELNGKECRRLLEENAQKLSMVVYSTIPMMITANCVKKTTDRCPKKMRRNVLFLIDRYDTVFPVACNCSHCYNIIYNSIPYSLHQKRKELNKFGLFALRLDFVWETGEQIEAILDYYIGKRAIFPVARCTTGHYKRGVE